MLHTNCSSAIALVAAGLMVGMGGLLVGEAETSLSLPALGQKLSPFILPTAALAGAIAVWRIRAGQARKGAGRRDAMEQLRQRLEAAEQAHASKTSFLAAASHDLRQPLQALGLFVATLAHSDLPAHQRRVVDKIEGSLEALEHLLDTLLDISRLDAGAVEAHSREFPVQKLFDRLAVEFIPLAEEKGLSIRFAPSSARACSDPALLERILRNLVSNAIRYTQGGGVVVGCRRRGGGLVIQVWDSGTGIAEAQHRDIFLEFHRLSAPGRDRRQGLGLGLAIVDRLARLLDHRIELRSVQGKGSVFSVVLAGVAGGGRRPGDPPGQDRKASAIGQIIAGRGQDLPRV